MRPHPKSVFLVASFTFPLIAPLTPMVPLLPITPLTPAAWAVVIPKPTIDAPRLVPRATRPAALPAVLVCFKESVALERLDRNRLAPGSRACRTVLESHGLAEFEALTNDAASPGARFAKLDLTGSSIDTDVEVAALIAELRATGDFRAVCPDYRMKLALTPNDPYYGNQWHAQELPNDADIQLPAAWNVATGSSSVKVAILDTGVDITHEDLNFAIATNPGEVSGNLLDDDMNGFVDDVKGWDFGSGDNDPHPEAFFEASGLDAGFHGSFCAGIAAAPANNGVGIAGAGFSTRILPIKVSANDDIPLSAVTSGFDYAALRGADILSISFGATGDDARDYFQALVDMATAAGVLCVASAGNDTSDVPVYPAACDDVVAVGASDDLNQRTFFSNYGPWVDIAAPGQYIWSTIAWNYDVDFSSEFFYYLFFEYDGLTPYMRGDGTSFAAPLVAGVAALVKAQHPGITPAELAQHLYVTGDIVAWDQPIGRKINALRAVTLPVVGVPDAGTTDPGVSDDGAPPIPVFTAAPNPFRESTRLAFELAAAGPVRVDIVDASGRLVRTIHEGPLAAGAHELRWDGASRSGRAVAAGVYFARIEAGDRASWVQVVRGR
jgi:subtilisin family serine protease